MAADGLTKALTQQQHENFVKLIKLDDIIEQIKVEKQMEALRDKIKDQREANTSRPAETVFLAYKSVK